MITNENRPIEDLSSTHMSRMNLSRNLRCKRVTGFAHVNPLQVKPTWRPLLDSADSPLETVSRRRRRKVPPRPPDGVMLKWVNCQFVIDLCHYEIDYDVFTK